MDNFQPMQSPGVRIAKKQAAVRTPSPISFPTAINFLQTREQ
jgi:hypothetical protein